MGSPSATNPFRTSYSENESGSTPKREATELTPMLNAVSPPPTNDVTSTTATTTLSTEPPEVPRRPSFTKTEATKDIVHENGEGEENGKVVGLRKASATTSSFSNLTYAQIPAPGMGVKRKVF